MWYPLPQEGTSGNHHMATLSICADLTQLATVREFVAQNARDLGMDEQGVYELQLAVDEACTNIIRHGYDGQDGEIEILIELSEGGLRLTMRDWGPAFDPQAVPTPDVTASLEERCLGGLGLFLMRQVTDNLWFEFDAEEGNTLTMVKRLPEGEE